ncbi:MAG: class I SAM-dependent methyltransferase [Candidatus Margulisiibacteriota bacterium]
MEKIFGPEPYTWNKEFDPGKLADYEVACTSGALRLMHKYLMGQIDHFRKQGREPAVMDAGCGYARWVIYLNRKGIKCTGVDQDAKVVSQVREFDAGLPLEIADLRELPFADNSFDLVYSFGVLEHLEEGMADALAEIHRVLRPGGRVLITVPTVNWIKGATKLLRNARRNLSRGKYRHFRECRYAREEVLETLKNSNFSVVACDVSDDSGVGLWEDFAFLRQPGIFKLNNFGRMVCRGLNAISPWITTWGILVVGEKE